MTDTQSDVAARASIAETLEHDIDDTGTGRSDDLRPAFHHSAAKAAVCSLVRAFARV